MTDSESREWIQIARVTGPYGVKGWLRVMPYTALPQSALEYRPWRFHHKDGTVSLPTLLDVQMHGKGFVVHLAECESRDTAGHWAGAVIEAPVAALPALDEGQYYWGQLVGLSVETVAGIPLGVVQELLATGANDVLIVRGERERLLPYIPHVIQRVEVEEGRIIVDWDADF